MNRPAGQRGTAAIELVIVLLFGLVLLNGLVLFGRLTWHLVALQKGVNGATRIMAALPADKLSGANAATSMRLFADAHVRSALRAAGTDLQPPSDTITAQCGGNTCYAANFGTVRVGAGLIFEDTIFGDTDAYLTSELRDWQLYASLNYVP